MGKIKFALPLFFIVFFVVVTPSFAHHRQLVLGDSTVASEVIFPEVTSGPGFILPDSPFYRFDSFWQGVKLSLARSPEDKAKVRAQIAGERLAELRVMLEENNNDGIDKALSQINKETQDATEELSGASARGENVEEAAKGLNEAIKIQRDILGRLSDQSTGELQLKFKVAREAVKASKLEIEDELPDDLLEKEIEDELENEIENHAEDAEDSALELESKIGILQDQASESARKSQKKREEVIKKAIEAKNEQLKKETEALLKSEKINAELVKKQQEVLREKAKKALEAAKEVNEQAQKDSESQNSGSSESLEDKSGSGSGSGSSNSGSGSSGSGGGDDH